MLDGFVEFGSTGCGKAGGLGHWSRYFGRQMEGGYDGGVDFDEFAGRFSGFSFGVHLDGDDQGV